MKLTSSDLWIFFVFSRLGSGSKFCLGAKSRGRKYLMGAGVCE